MAFPLSLWECFTCGESFLEAHREDDRRAKEHMRHCKCYTLHLVTQGLTEGGRSRYMTLWESLTSRFVVAVPAVEAPRGAVAPYPMHHQQLAAKSKREVGRTGSA